MATTFPRGVLMFVDPMTWDWGLITSRVATISTACMGVIGLIRRKAIVDYFVDRSRLRAERDDAVSAADAARATNADLHLAVDTAAFTNRQAKYLMTRVTALEAKEDERNERIATLEKYVPKFNSAMDFIRLLLGHLNLIHAWATSEHLVLPEPIPKIPFELLDDVVDADKH